MSVGAPTIPVALAIASRSPTVVDPALFPRGTVHVAAGMMAVQLRVSPAAALARLRAMAFAPHRRITEVAQDITAARLRFRPEGSGGN